MMKALYQKIENGERINISEALLLVHQGDFHELAHLAREKSLHKNGKKVAFLIDRNINYTNICMARCSFCAFYRPPKHKEGYDLSFAVLNQKIEETLKLGGTRILMQGGLSPEHNLDYYIALVSHIKNKFPTIHIHAFSPPEIHHVSQKSGVSYEKALTSLKQAGLGSMPGGGAEILVDQVRDQIVVGKCNSSQWLEIMETSHRVGIQSTATMMMGHVESWEDRIKHLDLLRVLQDKTHGFLSFIPWTFQPENTALHPRIKRNHQVNLANAFEYLKMLALSRIYLDNFDHLQVSLLTQGIKVAQIGLHFGADDFGSFLIEENVVRLAGKPQEIGLEKEAMAQIILESGYIPFERDTFYHPLLN